MIKQTIGRFLMIDQGVCNGKLAFKTTLLPVETVLNWLAQGKKVEAILDDWPRLKRDAISQAVRLAAAALRERYSGQITKARDSASSGLAPHEFIEPVRVGKHLAIHPRICFGKMTFKGTRVPVATVLHFLAAGYSLRDIQAGWPDVKPQAVAEAIRLARSALVEKFTPKSKPLHEPVRVRRSG